MNRRERREHKENDAMPQQSNDMRKWKLLTYFQLYTITHYSAQTSIQHWASEIQPPASKNTHPEPPLRGSPPLSRGDLLVADFTVLTLRDPGQIGWKDALRSIPCRKAINHFRDTERNTIYDSPNSFFVYFLLTKNGPYNQNC
jgi:hypothetical protein